MATGDFRCNRCGNWVSNCMHFELHDEARDNWARSLMSIETPKTPDTNWDLELKKLVEEEL